MKTMKKVEFELEGLCPLLMDKYAGDSKARSQEDYKRDAEKKVYADEKGLFIPGAAIKACIREAISELGQKRAGKQNRQMVKAGVFINDMHLGKKNHDGITEHLVSRGMGSKLTRVMSYRPIVKTWKASTTMTLIGIESDFVRQALELGGLKYGVLSYRPEFGRFIVNKFKEVD